MKIDYISQLPSEIVQEVLSYFPSKTLINISNTSLYFYRNAMQTLFHRRDEESMTYQKKLLERWLEGGDLANRHVEKKLRSRLSLKSVLGGLDQTQDIELRLLKIGANLRQSQPLGYRKIWLLEVFSAFNELAHLSARLFLTLTQEEALNAVYHLKIKLLEKFNSQITKNTLISLGEGIGHYVLNLSNLYNSQTAVSAEQEAEVLTGLVKIRPSDRKIWSRVCDLINRNQFKRDHSANKALLLLAELIERVPEEELDALSVFVKKQMHGLRQEATLLVDQAYYSRSHKGYFLASDSPRIHEYQKLWAQNYFKQNKTMWYHKRRDVERAFYEIWQTGDDFHFNIEALKQLDKVVESIHHKLDAIKNSASGQTDSIIKNIKKAIDQSYQMLARSIEEQVEPKDYAVMLCQHIKSLMRELRQTYGQPARDSRFRLWSKPDHVTELAPDFQI